MIRFCTVDLADRISAIGEWPTPEDAMAWRRRLALESDDLCILRLRRYRGQVQTAAIGAQVVYLECDDWTRLYVVEPE